MLTLTEITYSNRGDPWLILGYPKLNLRLTLAGTDCREPEIVCHNTI